ncbi:MAG: ribosome small subunit-dependent GTPase A [Jiangellales bacterium]
MEQSARAKAAGDSVRGRVSRVDRGGVEVAFADDTTLAVPSHADALVGDWVEVDVRATPATVVQVHPRSSVLSRASADRTSQEQGLVANVDVVVVVEPALPAPSLGRVERLLVLAWSSGAEPLVVLTKADLHPDGDRLCRDVQHAAPGVPVLAVSALSGHNLDDIRAHLGAGRTFVLLGPSGAGKSTLVNALAGVDLLEVGEVRGDGRGRHTTTHRQLVALPDGSVLVDTPGLRAVGLVGDADAVDEVFSEVTELAASCRFRDCAHEYEPDCAVTLAVAEGVLPQRRLASWRKMQREVAYQQRRGDVRAEREERAKWRARSKHRRGLNQR